MGLDYDGIETVIDLASLTTSNLYLIVKTIFGSQTYWKCACVYVVSWNLTSLVCWEEWDEFVGNHLFQNAWEILNTLNWDIKPLFVI